MSRTLAETDLAPSAVHAIIEIGGTRRLSAKDLSERLRLEKSTVSRLVKSLSLKGEIGEVRCEDDARIKRLHLTSRGELTLAAITRFAEGRVASAVAPLGGRSRQEILTGLETYSMALKASRESCEAITCDDRVAIRTGYVPGLIGRIVAMHADFYSRRVGFGAVFESQVASGVAGFVPRLESSLNEVWFARNADDEIVGCIAIDGQDLGGDRAHLRWFMVDDGLRGTGVGKALLGKAIAFCDDRGFSESQLWTFRGLDAARKLYERHGFSLAEEYVGDQWGSEVMEQKFIRPRHYSTTE